MYNKVLEEILSEFSWKKENGKPQSAQRLICDWSTGLMSNRLPVAGLYILEFGFGI